MSDLSKRERNGLTARTSHRLERERRAVLPVSIGKATSNHPIRNRRRRFSAAC
jgi:hypothetical protein